ncbi:gamma-glutamylcyclotransferase family protein [Patescibacteria group bacterium]
MVNKNNLIFVYGTLRLALVRFWVYGGWRAERKAILRGFRKEGLNIVKDTNCQVEGMLIVANEEDLRKIDKYESFGEKYYRDNVVLESGEDAWVYRKIK